MLRKSKPNFSAILLKDGTLTHLPVSEKTYAERLNEAERRSTEFFEAHFSDIDEFDEITGYFDKQVEVYEEVYFEIGLILGAKIGFQIQKRIEELH